MRQFLELLKWTRFERQQRDLWSTDFCFDFTVVVIAVIHFVFFISVLFLRLFVRKERFRIIDSKSYRKIGNP